jgi:hypothetical protein
MNRPRAVPQMKEINREGARNAKKKYKSELNRTVGSNLPERKAVVLDLLRALRHFTVIRIETGLEGCFPVPGLGFGLSGL